MRAAVLGTGMVGRAIAEHGTLGTGIFNIKRALTPHCGPSQLKVWIRRWPAPS